MAKFNLTDESLNRAHDTVAGTPRAATPVRYEVAARQAGIMCGVGDIVDLLTDHCAGPAALRGKPDGQPIQPGEIVLAIEGPFGDLVTLETLYQGILSLSAAAGRMASLVETAGTGIKLIDLSARRFPPELISSIAMAAALGGARGTFTQAGHAAVLERWGVGGNQICIGSRSPVSFRLYHAVPPVLQALYGLDLVECSAAYQAAASEVSLIVRLADPGRERDMCAEVVRRFSSDLDAVWLDTPSDALHQGGHETPSRALEMRILSQAADRGTAQAALGRQGFGPGVTIEAVYGLRDLLDSLGARSTDIMVGGGFSAEKIQDFRSCSAPVNLIATDDWVEFGTFSARLASVSENGTWTRRTQAGPAAAVDPWENLPLIYQK